MAYVKGDIDRNQLSLVPIAFDELIDSNNPVRAIDAFVDSLDLFELGFKFAKTPCVGRPAYHPKDMLKIYLYGNCNGVRSSRKLEKECRRNIELLWLINGLKPDDKTIANFRHDNRSALIEVFKYFGLFCQNIKLMKNNVVAIDGSKIRAWNSRHNSYTKRKVEKLIEYYRNNATMYLELLDSSDKENNVETSDASTVKAKVEHALKRIEELKEMEIQIKETGEINTTDPDCRHMKTSNNGTDLAYNMQLAVDVESHLITSVDTVNSPCDSGQLSRMALKAKEDLNTTDLTVLGDKGYFSTEEIKICEENDIVAIVSVPKTAAPAGDARYAKSNFEYDKNRDEYICPMGKRLKRKNKKESDRRYKCDECQGCIEKENCTKKGEGRTLRFTVNEEMENARKRHKDNIELYKKRQQTVEHVFGTIKRGHECTYYLTKGLQSVNSESHMFALAYNIKRVIHIIGVQAMTLALKKFAEARKIALCKGILYLLAIKMTLGWQKYGSQA